MSFFNKNKNNENNNGTYHDTPGINEIERIITKLDTLKDKRKKQTILITSAVSGEGKSTISSYIARSMALNRKNTTLLVDFDLRRSRIHQIFGLTREDGLTDILKSGLLLERCVKNTSIPNLQIITSGLLEENPLNLLKANLIKDFFNLIKKSYTNIIIDAPPVMPVSDPLVLAKEVDDVFLVIRAGKTPRNAYKRVIDMLYDVKVEISGIIVNNVDKILPYQYDGRYHGYDYYDSNKY